jgi:hypothetical protein
MTRSTGFDKDTRRLFQMIDLFPYNLSVAHALQRVQSIRVTNSGYKPSFVRENALWKALKVS